MKNISVYGAIGNRIGYGVYTENLFKALNRQIPSVLFADNVPEQDYILKGMANRASHTIPDVALSVGDTRSVPYFHGKHRAFITMWECSVIAPERVKMLNTTDTVITTSEWMKEVFRKSGIDETKLCVARGGVDTQFFTPQHSYLKRTDKPFTFLIVGKYEERKSTAKMIQAFLETFKAEDNVSLECKISSPVAKSLTQVKQELAPLFEKSDPKVVSKISVLDDVPTLLPLYRQADCFLMASAAEGVGMPLLEAMACGVPCITTPYTAHKEYFTPEAGICLADRGQEPCKDDYYGIKPETHGKWGAVMINDIGQAMKAMYQKPAEELLVMSKAARKHSLQFDWEELAKKIIKILGERT